MQQIRNPRRQQAGFTLIEIAIVLVIIGLLLGGVLKGQELITNSKTRNAINDLNGIAAAYNAYIDRYRRVPGDDGPDLVTLTGRGGSWANVTQFGDNNGVLGVNTAQTFTGGAEGDNFFQHLRAAGFITGNPADDALNALPRNAFGGSIGVTAAAAGMTTNAVCLGRVPGKGASQIDTQLDDGLPNTGRVRGYTSGANANTQPNTVAPNYNEDNVFTVCAEI